MIGDNHIGCTEIFTLHSYAARNFAHLSVVSSKQHSMKVLWLRMQRTLCHNIRQRADKVCPKGERKMKTKRISQLEGLRFIMCCIIILSHFEFLFDSNLIGGV